MTMTVLEKLKGGIGGKSTRMRERFLIEKPANNVLDEYLIDIPRRSLYLGENIPRLTAESLFNNSRRVHMDLGCGRGEFVIENALSHPEHNYVGIDYHARSLYFGVNRSAKIGLKNVKFVLANLPSLLPYIPSDTVEGVSVLFPAPIVDHKNKDNDLVKESLIRQIHRILIYNCNFLFMSDAEWYFKEKIELILSLGILSLLTMSQGIEEPVTRYQKQWQSKGISTSRAVLRKINY